MRNQPHALIRKRKKNSYKRRKHKQMKLFRKLRAHHRDEKKNAINAVRGFYLFRRLLNFIGRKWVSEQIDWKF